MTMDITNTTTGGEETAPREQVELQVERLSSVVLGDLNDETTCSSTSSGMQPGSNLGSVSEYATGGPTQSSDVNMSDDDEGVEAIGLAADKPATSKPNVANLSKKRTAVPQNMGRSRHLLKKDKGVLLDGRNFMGEFDPSNSSRNQQKKKKRYHPVDGRLIQYASDYEICDCLQPSCRGCHYPCKTCGDSRCGKECRLQRKWIYDSVEVDGRDKEIKNPHASVFV